MLQGHTMGILNTWNKSTQHRNVRPNAKGHTRFDKLPGIIKHVLCNEKRLLHKLPINTTR